MDSPEREKLRQTETEKLATIRAKIDNGEPLTEREATLLAKFTKQDEQARIEQVLHNVPIDVWNEAVERNHVAPTPPRFLLNHCRRIIRFTPWRVAFGRATTNLRRSMPRSS